MRILFHLIIMILALNCFAQKNYEYKFQLKASPSSIRIYNGHLDSNSNGNFYLLVMDKDKKAIDFARVHLTSGVFDTTIFTDQSGTVVLRIPEGRYTLEIDLIGFTPVKSFQFEANRQQSTEISAYLGRDLSLKIGKIISSRKLTKKERQSIIQKLQNSESHQLIDDGSCRISWEI